MTKPVISNNMERVARKLFTDQDAQRNFCEALIAESSKRTAVAWINEASNTPSFHVDSAEKPQWIPEWIDIVGAEEQPGISTEHQGGKIYCLDLSSVFALAPLFSLSANKVKDEINLVIDMCAAPGGKGIVSWRNFKPQLIVANEVMNKRTAALISNYKRCSIAPSMITSCDPGLLASLVSAVADLVIVDAPCSGQSLLVKGMPAPGAFHRATIALNERRQRRILANSASLVRPGGYLLYATCTFSIEENEKNMDWFCKTFPDFATVPVDTLADFSSPHGRGTSYRLFPQHGYGAGAFACLLKRSGEAGSMPINERVAQVVSSVRAMWSAEIATG